MIILYKTQDKIRIVLNNKRISEKIITGRILHLDGDRRYSQKSYMYYKKNRLNSIVKHIPEYLQPLEVYDLLKIYNPDILVITGHDSMIKKNTDYDNIYNYKNSKYFIETVREARRYEKDYSKDLVIFAGACESYYEAIMSAGANFASSPARILIDFLDPLRVAKKVATTDEYKYVTITDIYNQLKDGKKRNWWYWSIWKTTKIIYVTLLKWTCNIIVILIKINLEGLENTKEQKNDTNEYFLTKKTLNAIIYSS